MIEIQHLTKSYRKLKALEDISISLSPGEAIALIGPNGSGKSTLMKCILGLVHAGAGNILINGKQITSAGDYREKIGYMPQIVRFPDNTKVYQLFKIVQDIRRSKMPVDDELVHAFEIDTFINKPLGSLSGGMKQKVNAALAFMFHPDILIQEEPTAGLDPLSAELLKEKIKKEKAKRKLIIISSHIMADLEEITSTVLYLIEGRVEFFKTTASLMLETGAPTLGKAIAAVMAHTTATHEDH